MCGSDFATKSISIGGSESAAPTSRIAWRARYVSNIATVAARSL